MRRLISIISVIVLTGWMVFGCGAARTQSPRKAETPAKTTDPATTPAPIDSSARPSAEPSIPISAPDTLLQPQPTPDTVLVAQPLEDIPYETIPADTTAIADSLRQEVLEDIPYETEVVTTPIDSTTINQPDSSATSVPVRPITADSTATGQTPATPTDQQTPQEQQPSDDGQSSGGPRIVDFTADIMRPVTVPGDSTALNLLGNVVLHHNGAVITCDSAVRYSDKRMECFKRVVINQGTTYVYGDRADYSGEINLASVYAPIIKVVDEDAVLYTYQFTFNTLDNIGRYDGGATMTHGDNLMESKRGYYYADTREFIGVDSVELRNPDYRLKSDSASYNIGTETASFFTETFIWNDKGEILSAERGNYENQTDTYRFSQNSFILTATREIWADSINYTSPTEDVVMVGNIQIDDTEQNVTAFGDYGQYWGTPQNLMLTRDPAMMSYDPQEPDTLYMRADSMFMYTFNRDEVFTTTQRPTEPTLTVPGEEQLDGPITEMAGREGGMIDVGQARVTLTELQRQMIREGDLNQELLDTLRMQGVADSLIQTILGGGVDPDELFPTYDEADSVSQQQQNIDPTEEIIPAPDSVTADPVIPAISEKQQLKEQRAAQKRAEREEKRSLRKGLKESIMSGEYLREHAHDGYDPDKVVHNHDHHGHNHNHSHDHNGDVTSGLMSDSIPSGAALTAMDSLAGTQLMPDTLLMSAQTDSLSMAEPSQQDSLQRVFRGYRDVRIYRTDFQAVCDSLVGFSIDSTLHLHINPVLWSEENQIKSDVIDLYTKDEQLYKAEFFGSPFASSQVDTTRYNQIKGKFMEAWFRDNSIYRHDVVGNGQTYYYMEDDATGDLMGFLVAECADISFFIEDQKMDRIVYRFDPVYTIFPMDKIPPEQDEFLPGFVWEAERRPLSREDVLSRNIRPSQREAYESMPQPEFPLTQRILQHRDNMIQRGVWRERNDRLSAETLDFVRSVTRE